MILQNIWRRVVGNVLIYISPSNIFLTMFLPARFYLICPAVVAAPNFNGIGYLVVIRKWQTYFRSNNCLQAPSTECLSNQIFLYTYGISTYDYFIPAKSADFTKPYIFKNRRMNSLTSFKQMFIFSWYRIRDFWKSLWTNAIIVFSQFGFFDRIVNLIILSFTFLF